VKLLNVGKAFVTSTASGVDFVDAQGRNYNFGANRAGDAPLLTIDPNVAFNPAKLIMNASIPGSRGIENYGTLQTTNSGQYVGLIGGNVTFNGGQINAPGGRVDIGGLNTAGSVSIGKEGLVFAGNGLIRSDVSLPDAFIDVSADRKLEGINTFFSKTSLPGSSINISGNNVQIDRAYIITGLANNSGIQTAPTGDININANGKLTLNYAFIVNGIESGAEGQLGNININADSLISNGLFLGSGLYQGGKGSGGNINIKTNGNLNLTDSKIDTSTDGQGDAGQIAINTNGKLLIDNSRIFSGIASVGVGNSKGIKIDAGELELTNASSISSSTSQSALVKDKGNAGDIDLKITGNLTIAKDSFVTSSTFGKGDAGQITINTNGKLFVDKGRITSQITSTGVGNSKGIKIDAGDLVLTNQSNISTTTRQSALVNSKGNAGDIDLKTKGNMIIDSSGIYSNSDGSGNAGKINLDVRDRLIIFYGAISNSIFSRLVDKNGTVLANENFSIVNIITPNQQYSYLSLRGVGNWPRITANTSVGNSQAITIKAHDLLLVNSSISSRTGAKGNVGDIKIGTTGNADIFSSTISTNTTRYGEGKTGKVSIDTGGKLTLNNSEIQSIVWNW
jgi:hypothetical protein